jgi:hypothetical protein
LKAELLKDTEAAPSAAGDERLVTINGKPHFPAGTIIEHPQAYRLVKMGVAKPADGECVVAAGMTTEQQQAAQVTQELVSKGIHPEDYQAYLDGIMIGYDEDGKYIPGPNYTEDEPDGDDEE